MDHRRWRYSRHGDRVGNCVGKRLTVEVDLDEGSCGDLRQTGKDRLVRGAMAGQPHRATGSRKTRRWIPLRRPINRGHETLVDLVLTTGHDWFVEIDGLDVEDVLRRCRRTGLRRIVQRRSGGGTVASADGGSVRAMVAAGDELATTVVRSAGGVTVAGGLGGSASAMVAGVDAPTTIVARPVSRASSELACRPDGRPGNGPPVTASTAIAVMTEATTIPERQRFMIAPSQGISGDLNSSSSRTQRRGALLDKILTTAQRCGTQEVSTANGER